MGIQKPFPTALIQLLRHSYSQPLIPCVLYNFHSILTILSQITLSMLSVLIENCNRQMEEMEVNPDEEEFQIPDDVVHDAALAHQHSLLIRPTNPRRQNLRPMIRFLPRLWGMDDVVHGRLIPQNRALFVFPSQEALVSVIRRGPWSFNEWMLSSGPWEGGIPDGFPDSVLFWIQIREIPVQFYTYSVVSHIADTLGEIVESDFNLESSSTREYARVRVNWPINRPLCFQRRFRFGRHDGVLILFRFEKLRNYCFRCRSLCHDVDECLEPPEMGHHTNPPGDDEAGPSNGTLNPRFEVPLLPMSPTAVLPTSQPRLQIGDAASSTTTPSDMINLNGNRFKKSDLSALCHRFAPMEPRSSSLTHSKDKGKRPENGLDSQLMVEASRYYNAKRKRITPVESVGECSGNGFAGREADSPDSLNDS